MEEDQFVVVRTFKPGDESECGNLVYEGVMSTVRPAFFNALTREVTFQIVITTAAVMFVFIGLSPTISLSSVPATVVFIFICVYFSHLQRAAVVKNEALNITKHFLSSRYTGFWVAELYESKPTNSKPTQKYLIVKEEDLNDKLNKNKVYTKKIIGTMGIDRCEVMHDSAWLRRMNVSHKYQRKGIGTALLNEAIKFCQNKGYETLELVTSECHDGARQLYLQKGFKLRQLYHKPIFGTIIQILMYQFTFTVPPKNPGKKMI